MLPRIAASRFCNHRTVHQLFLRSSSSQFAFGIHTLSESCRNYERRNSIPEENEPGDSAPVSNTTTRRSTPYIQPQPWQPPSLYNQYSDLSFNPRDRKPPAMSAHHVSINKPSPSAETHRVPPKEIHQSPNQLPSSQMCKPSSLSSAAALPHNLLRFPPGNPSSRIPLSN